MAARLALRGNEANHYQLRIAGVGQRRSELVARVLGVSTVLATQPIGAGAVKLQVEAFQNRYVFSYRVRGQAARTIGTLPTADLSSEKLADSRYIGRHVRRWRGRHGAGRFCLVEYQAR